MSNPMQSVTLVFLRDGEHVLLAMKKRGHGAGKYNGVGGKTMPDETVEDAAIRECQEEIGVTPLELRPIGRIAFDIADDPDFGGHDMHIFTCTKWKGELQESDEMEQPQWFAPDAIPYPQMWSDDPLWLPLLLQGLSFAGTVIIDKAGKLVQTDIKTTRNSSL
jgi:8-oxo-dGTP diphosphatase